MPENLTDDKILKSLPNNELHIQFDEDKQECMPVGKRAHGKGLFK